MKRPMVVALAATMLMAATVVAEDETADPTTTATPHATATTAPEAEAPRIRWASSGIELIADELRLQVKDTVLTAPGEVLPLGNTYADHGELEAWWFEQGTQQRLNFNIDLDEIHWWIDSIWAYDQHGRNSEWIYFEDLKDRTLTPLGEPFVDDLDLQSTDASRKTYRPKGSAVLRLDGLHLSAFMPGTRPAPLTGCDYLVDDDVEVTWDAWPEGGGSWSTSYTAGILQGPDEPLKGWKRMSPKEAEAALRAAGLCYRFDHSWSTKPRFEDRRLDRELEATSTDAAVRPGQAGSPRSRSGPTGPPANRTSSSTCRCGRRRFATGPSHRHTAPIAPRSSILGWG